jgi:hypothetical protein
MRGLVAGRRDDVENAPAEIVMGDPVRPIVDMEEGGDVLRLEPDDLGIRAIAELIVAGMMIAMTVRVRDDEVDRLPAVSCLPIGDQPIDRRPNLEPAGAAVDEQDALLTEQQIEEGRFEVLSYRRKATRSRLAVKASV